MNLAYANLCSLILKILQYFYNWTGNRVTWHDWFQLSLKEGLIIFRDQEFSSDLGSHMVKRIANVSRLRNYQFPQVAFSAMLIYVYVDFYIISTVTYIL
ncbi:hypothetical protein Sjap_022190 [Stephania japonica]|uniref:Peptidase M1 membrane alanine aminopeptidase domain-containing protein n=1 Tax=Stephania japonica TaxID=461633 RepID=A0AAP0EU41_9MAGN